MMNKKTWYLLLLTTAIFYLVRKRGIFLNRKKQKLESRGEDA